MDDLRDYTGDLIRVTDERVAHLLRSHPEMEDLETRLQEVVGEPEIVVGSATDPLVALYYRYYENTPLGAYFMCVVAKKTKGDAFVITAYLTDRVKKGPVLWEVKA